MRDRGRERCWTRRRLRPHLSQFVGGLLMRYVVWIAALALTGLIGCQTVKTTEGGVVGIDRKQTMSPLVPADAFNRAAADEYQKVLQGTNKKGQLNRDPAQVERVRRVANRLIPNTGAFRADAPGWAWEVNVISSDEVNAWCMPGGKIAVYAGILAKLDPTDDELAAVMGHEISHALREHSREQASIRTPRSRCGRRWENWAAASRRSGSRRTLRTRGGLAIFRTTRSG